MILKKYKPITPSRRNTITINKKKLWQGKPYKKLISKIKRKNGRNNLGRITCRYKCIGKKKKNRQIDFKRNRIKKGEILREEYDPNRSAYIVLIKNNKKKSYILSPKNNVNHYVFSNETKKVSIGNCLSLKNIPLGIPIHNIEIKPKKGGQIARAAGTFAIIVNKKEKYIYLKLRSGEIKKISSLCKGTIGIVSNINNKNIKLGKAGYSKWLGKKPKVRGTAKNPIDHPHGGGEGKTSGGRHPVTPWGKPTKGYKTKKNR